MSAEQPAKKKASATAKGLAGAAAGVIETLCVWPLESTKTKIQLQRKLATPAPFTGVIGCVKYTVRTTGFFSLYHGMFPVILGSVPKAGLRFGVFAKLDEVFTKADGTTTPIRTLVAGSVAGALEALLVVTPVETVKTKLIALKMKTVPGIAYILKTDGLQGIYKGAMATTLKQSSNQGLRFMAFAQYKTLVLQVRGTSKLNDVEAVVGGMCAGMFSTMANNIFDVVKTRMQGLDGAKYSGFFDCVRQIARNEGVLTFWAGLTPRLARVVPGQGIIFASSERITTLLSDYLHV